jgi:hypothetical protein
MVLWGMSPYYSYYMNKGKKQDLTPGLYDPGIVLSIFLVDFFLII